MKAQAPCGREYWIGHSAEHGIVIRDDTVHQPKQDAIFLWSRRADEMVSFAKEALETSVLSYSSVSAGKSGDELRRLDDDMWLAIHEYEGWLTNGRYVFAYSNKCWRCEQAVDDRHNKRCHKCRLFICGQGHCYCNAPPGVVEKANRALAAKGPTPAAISYSSESDGSGPPGS